MTVHHLVTGGCGFVGRNLTRRLLPAHPAATIWVVDDLSTGRKPAAWLPAEMKAAEHAGCMTRYAAPGLAELVVAECDMLDYLRPDQEFEALHGPHLERPAAYADAFHFAAVVGGRVKIETDPIQVALDLALDARFFAWAVKNRPTRILYASSSAAYPIDLQADEASRPLRESDISFESRLGKPDMTYGWAKLTGEYLARLAARDYGLHVACIRPFSGYGEDQEPEYPIPAIARRAAAREDPLTVWGTGRQGRDFVHIDDCVEGILLALERISDGSAVNLASGALTTFLEVAALFAQLAGYKPTIRPLSDMPSGVHARCGDTRLAEETLGWRPRISLEQGFARVLSTAERTLRHPS